MIKDKIVERWYSLKRKVPFYWVIIIALTAALPYNIYINHFNLPVAHNDESIDNCSLPFNLTRVNNKKFVQHLLFAGLTTEDERLMPLKEKITNYINEKKGGVLKTASVYFNVLDSASGWFVINPDEKYNPASIMKVAFAITMLKEAENNPSILDKTVYYSRHSSSFHDQAILQHQLPPDKSYSIKELLRYTLAYSDNDAAYKVVDNFKESDLQKLMESLNMPHVNFKTEYYATVEEISRLFRVLYNASYLSKDMSEYALELLTQSDFNDGMIKKLDKDIVVARKFGERGIEDNKELHEYGIVYLYGKPYLLGIMTRGSDYKALEDVISDISLMAYQEMAKVI